MEMYMSNTIILYEKLYAENEKTAVKHCFTAV
jgi:hypothetical protein